MKTGAATVLLVYPTLYRITGYPIGLGSICSVLKNEGYEVRVFDTCFYKETNRDQEDLRARILSTKRIETGDQYWRDNLSNPKEDLIGLIKELRPIVVGITVSENTFIQSMELTRHIKKYYKDLIIVAGGIFPTLSPDIFINEASIDIVCIGEGELSFLELCNKIKNNNDFPHTDGFWVKKAGRIYKNKLSQLPDINRIPFPDFSAFDERLSYKPMQGKLRKMVFAEASRGCAFKCSYCENSKLKDFYANNSCGRYYRHMDMNHFLEQIWYQIGRHSPEFLYITSEDFLAINDKQFDLFINGYSKIKMPFFFQTRFKTISDKRIKALLDVGLFWLSTGIEHGNEAFRRKVLNRTCLNAEIFEAIHVLKANNLGATLQNMMGFPYENRELVFDTINLDRELFQIHNKLQFNINMFIPYRSCKLYELCKESGLISNDYRFFNDKGAHDGETPLKFHDSYRKELNGLWKTFNLYVKLPKEYEPQIKIAEQDDEEGHEMYQLLCQGVSS